MTDENPGSLRDRYRARLAERRIDRRTASKEIGVASDTLYQWMHGRESNFTEAKVAAWLDRPVEQPSSPFEAPPVVGPDEVMDRLNEQNRILLEARMLPRGVKLTDEHIDTVRAALERHIKAFGTVPAQIAREVNYKPSVISQWQSGKYKGDNTAVTHAINDWIERDARRQKAKRPIDYVDTDVAETMRTVAYQADKLGLMAIIVAPAGSGKTKVLQALTEELRGIYIYADPEISERELLLKICHSLGRATEAGSRTALRQFIVDKLRNTRRMILIDEAQQMHKAIRTVRAIFDQAEVPIVMAGTHEILEYTNDRADGRGQFSSRCIRWNVVESLRNPERSDGGKAGRALFTVEEILKFFKSKQIRLSKDALMFMWALACLPSHGTLRLVEKLAAIAMDAYPKAPQIEREHVAEALMLFRGVNEGTYLESAAAKFIEAEAA